MIEFPHVLPRLNSNRVTLRALEASDIPAWFARASDPESAALAGDAIPDCIERGAEWLARHQARFRQKTGLRWAIIHQGESVGTVGLSLCPEEPAMAEIGFVVGRAHWGKGLCSESVALVVAYALETMRLLEIQAEVLAANSPSRRVLEKCGFTLIRNFISDAECCIYSVRSNKIS